MPRPDLRCSVLANSKIGLAACRRGCRSELGRVEYYADDRALHAIYPLKPRTTEGELINTDAREQVAVRLNDGLLEEEAACLTLVRV